MDQGKPEMAAPAEEEALPISAMPGHLIRRMQQSAVVIFDTAMQGAGLPLTAVQFAALVAIDRRPGLDQASLAAVIAYDRVTIGGVIDRLEQKGFVRREIAQGDRRSRRLHLEPAGQEILARAFPIVEESQRQILHGLSAAEAQDLHRLLRKALLAIGDRVRPSSRGR